VPEAAERFISGLDDSLRRVQQKSPPRGSKEGFRLDNLQREPCAAHSRDTGGKRAGVRCCEITEDHINFEGASRRMTDTYAAWAQT
jgi:hypothetical protein